MIERGAQYLWMQVLHAAIEDAFQGVRGSSNDTAKRLRKVIDARDYLTKPNTDFDTVCALAGMDADAVRTRMQAKLQHLYDDGLHVVELRQAPLSMGVAIGDLERTVNGKLIRHDGHPVLRHHFDCVVASRNETTGLGV